jgi:hypothetical protein
VGWLIAGSAAGAFGKRGQVHFLSMDGVTGKTGSESTFRQAVGVNDPLFRPADLLWPGLSFELLFYREAEAVGA